MSPVFTRMVLCVFWLASLGAAYYFGTQQASSVRKSPQGSQAVRASQGGNGLNGMGGAADRDPEGGEQPASVGAEKAGDIDVPSLIARIRTQVGSGPGMMYNPSAMMKAMAPLADLSVAQVREALVEVEATVTNPQQKMMFYSLLLGRLAETEGAEAMAYVEQNVEGNVKGPIAMSVIGTWARMEPDAAWKWYLENRDTDSSQVMMGFGQATAIFAGMAAQDLDGAFQRLEQLDDLERAQAITGIATGGAWDPEFREDLLQRARSLPADSRKNLYQGILGQWVMSDADSALEWLNALDSEERQPLAQQAGTMLMMVDPERGAGFMLENVTEAQRPVTYSSIVAQWAQRDPNAAGEWLNEQPDGAHLDIARATFAGTVAGRDPYSAMEWAKTVSEENQRRGAIRQVYAQWKRKDAAAAEAALDQSGLSAEQIEGIRQGITEPGTPVDPFVP